MVFAYYILIADKIFVQLKKKGVNSFFLEMESNRAGSAALLPLPFGNAV